MKSIKIKDLGISLNYEDIAEVFDKGSAAEVEAKMSNMKINNERQELHGIMATLLDLKDLGVPNSIIEDLTVGDAEIFASFSEEILSMSDRTKNLSEEGKSALKKLLGIE